MRNKKWKSKSFYTPFFPYPFNVYQITKQIKRDIEKAKMSYKK